MTTDAGTQPCIFSRRGPPESRYAYDSVSQPECRGTLPPGRSSNLFPVTFTFFVEKKI